MPVAGGDDEVVVAGGGERVDPLGDRVAVRDRERAARREVVLEVDDDERAAQNLSNAPIPPSGTRSSWWRTTIAFADCSIAFSIAGSTMSVDRLAGVGLLGQQQPGLEVHAPGGAEVLGDQQRLHARLVERVEHLGDPGRAAPAAADALGQAVERLALAAHARAP